MPRKPLQRRDIRGCRFRPSLDFIWCVHFPHSSITFLLCGVYVAASDSWPSSASGGRADWRRECSGSEE